MILSKKQRRLFVIFIVIATLGLLLTSFLPYLTAFQ
ncbi:MAG: hypothetical protein UX95_C0002G0003 [Candidatus Woesebacteria bacterium GW2011_GWD1_47_21]|uniref:Uncharacterized protein n=2 Tax=Candidatus Woeseibacteriota TaxID=1752722 RepID=A0A0G1T587_9BACT|nr:MAG: hypothetical protein UX67_C0002G0028 [Candidatus Woesebacteria bacterium GW2011_GWF2_46_8]KKU71182.1 MAG: hypothetical protein UX95_C0002G0003 [Candidatus Woesebacteria bacterium GW2011_GWD1_47_21]